MVSPTILLDDFPSRLTREVIHFVSDVSDYLPFAEPSFSGSPPPSQKILPPPHHYW
jgi:hypothetical protein